MADASPVFEERNPYEKGFSAYFDANIVPHLDTLENDRRRGLERFKNAITIGIVVVAVSFILLFRNEAVFHSQALASSIDGFGAFFSKYNDPNTGKGNVLLFIIFASCAPPFIIAAAYGQEAKKLLLPPLLKFFGDLNYDVSKNIQPDQFAEFDLLPPYSDHVVTNHITGTLDGIPLNLAQLQLTQGSGKQRRTVFNGITVLLRMDKPFEGKTIVRNAGGSLYYSLTGNTLQKVTLEDVVFDKWFNVYSSDQVLARCVLTPSFMEQLMQLAQLMHTWGEENPAPQTSASQPHDISCGFYNNGVFLTIPCNVVLFEPGSLFESAYNTHDMRKVLHQISLIRGIIETLKLDRRANRPTDS